jgi:DNA primase
MSKIPENIIEQIKDKISIAEFIGKTIKLERKGNVYLGLCPFHKEKTPSFNVMEHKNFYHCFGCGASGDIVEFLIKSQHLNFVEAVESLAKLAGITIPKIISLQNEKQNQLKNDIFEVIKEASNWFANNLKTNTGFEAQKYLNERNINDQDIKEFNIGFVPSSKDGLIRFLRDKGYKDKIILDAGLAIKKASGQLMDRFHNRIIFPIYNYKNQIVGFGGRTISDEVPKYLNSPETEVFKKGELLFGWNLLDPVNNSKPIIIVEGYIDVIALHKNGFNVVAALGTSLTQHQIIKLWRQTNEPIICMDGDKAGQVAMQRVAYLVLEILKEGFSLRFASLPANKDPDEVIKTKGKDYFNSIINNATPLSELLWNHEYTISKIATPEEKAALELRLKELTNKIKNDTVKNNYNRFFTDKIWKNLRKLESNKYIKSATLITEKEDVIIRYQRSLVAMLLLHPFLLKKPDIFEHFVSIDFTESTLDDIRTATLDLYTNSQDDNLELIDNLNKRGLNIHIDKLCNKDSTYLDMHLKNLDEEKLHERWIFGI